MKQEGTLVTVKGPKGELAQRFSPDMKIRMEEGKMLVERPSDGRIHRSLHGLTRSLLNNMVKGVTDGFEQVLEIQGVGYRAQKKGEQVELSLGHSHPVVVTPPAGIEIDVTAPTRVVVKGINKEQVGQVAAEIRGARKVEPYKGKGVRYAGEYVRRKVGKAAAK